MKRKTLVVTLGLMLCLPTVWAENGAASETPKNKEKKLESAEAVQIAEVQEQTPRKKRFTVGGYGEAVYSRNFYSDNYLRYDSPNDYKDDKHGRFDLPHVVIMLGYDFGHGWTMGSEIEFEHGGPERAVGLEEHEGGE